MSDFNKGAEFMFNRIAMVIATNGKNLTPEMKLEMIIEKMNTISEIHGWNSKIITEK